MDLIKLDEFPSIAANSPFTLNIDNLAGRALHGIILEQGGTFTKAHLTNLELKIGGKDLFKDITGTQMQTLNTYDGLPDDTGYVGMFLGDPMANTQYGQHLTDLDLSIYTDTLTLKGTIGGATSPTLQAYALVGPPKAQMGLFSSQAELLMTRALIPTVIQPAAAVSRKSYRINVGSNAGAHIRKVGFFHTNLTSVELKTRGLVRHEDASDALNDHVQSTFARAPQSGLYVLDRTVDGYQGKAEPTLDREGNTVPMTLSLTTSAADTIDAFTDVRVGVGLL
jgi:hypothetical protein